MTPKKRREKPILAFVENRMVELQRTIPTGIEHPNLGPYLGKPTLVTFPFGSERDEMRAYPWASREDDDSDGAKETANPLGLPDVWTREGVAQWLGEAFLTLRRMPAKGCWPGVFKSSWTEWLRDVWVAVNKDDQMVTQDLESARRQPTMIEIGRMDIALSWPFWITDVDRRKAAVTVAMGFGLRTCGRIVGCSHVTVKAWAVQGHQEITDRLNEGAPAPLPPSTFGGKA